MTLKRLLTTGLVCGVAITAFALPVYAHHGSGRHSQAVSCPAVCALEQCDQIGRHYHDGVQYCGYAHSSGYCDGSCLNQVTGCGQGGHHGHHGGHH